MTATGLGLQARLLLITALVLGACLGSVAWLLDRSFAAAVRSGAQQQLRAVAYGLQAAVDEQNGALAVGGDLGDPRLTRRDSGLFAYVVGDDLLWRSPSMLASGVAMLPPSFRRPAPGELYFGTDDALAPGLFVLAYTAIWESADDTELTLWVLADRQPYLREIAAFRRDIAVGLASAAAAFIAIQFAALRWGLAPVRRMAQRLRGLEAGTRRDIGADYPRELSALARNLNRFIVFEAANRERYRRAMDDLAHSLKTPLAVLANVARDLPRREAAVFEEQMQRMQNTVGRQLARAQAAQSVVAAPVAAMATAGRVAHALQQVHAEQRVAVELADNALTVLADERDLMEMLGNLVENAFKYCRGRVRISARAGDGAVTTVVEDDGDGIAEELREHVLRRGVRADAARPGQGLGLALVQELAQAYGGSLTLGVSDLGGVAASLRLPGGR